MKKKVLFLLLISSAVSIWATDVPSLLILTTASEEVEIPIASVQKITYNDQGTEMYVLTATGTQTYAVANVSKMTLTNVPEPTSIDRLIDSPTQRFTKVVKDGVVYVVKDGKLFTMKGESVQ